MHAHRQHRLYFTTTEAAKLTRVELCPQAWSLAQSLARRVMEDGGGALLIDYGREHPPYEDSLQAIRRHDVVSPLDAPGTADLSCWVDFGAIKCVADGHARCSVVLLLLLTTTCWCLWC